MKVLVIGGGGREHAMVWKLKQSPRVRKIWCAPGNPGMEKLAERLPVAANDIDKLLRFAKKEAIDLTVVGPEGPLVAGIVDRFRAEGLKIFGPDKNAAQLEGSKSFAKNLMKKLGIPTADFREFDKPDAAMDYIAKMPLPIVIKVDGLAGGKGVSIVHSRPKAMEAVHLAMMKKVFGKAGERVVIEEFLEGPEASLIAITDGKTIQSLASSQDHKRVFDGDNGPNTGGMGAYSPASFVSADIEKEAHDKIFVPLVEEFRAAGHPFVGFIYAGVMLTSKGMKVLEFNVRLGDPEAQAILPRLESDFAELLLACCEERLAPALLKWKEEDCVCVVLTSEGYPGDFEKGKRISGIGTAEGLPSVVIFHAGTDKQGTDFVTAGGRVLNVVASGRGIFQALSRTYDAVNKIYFPGMHYRKDIASRALEKGGSKAK